MTPEEIRAAANTAAKLSSALAFLNPVLAAIPTVTIGVGHLIAWVQEIREAAKTTGEWTDAMDDQFEASLIARATTPAYQPDKK